MMIDGHMSLKDVPNAVWSWAQYEDRMDKNILLLTFTFYYVDINDEQSGHNWHFVKSTNDSSSFWELFHAPK